MSGYQVGDLVVLISGSCPMTVTEVHEESHRLSVAWMEQASEGEGGFSWRGMQRSVLPMAAVQHAPSGGAL